MTYDGEYTSFFDSEALVSYITWNNKSREMYCDLFG